MDAVGFLCLILFIIGLCLAVYYAYICYDVPSSRTHTILHSDDGSLHKYTNDFNGNESVVIPVERIDEPDLIDQSNDMTKSDVGSDNITEASNPSAPECTSKEKVVTHSEVEHVQLERTVPSKTEVLLDVEPLRPLPNSDEEDGLIFSQETASSILASGRLNGSSNGDKHVHFPYIDTDDGGEGASCDQPPAVRLGSNSKIAFHKSVHGAERISNGKIEETFPKPEVRQGYHHNPIHDITVKVIMPNSTHSSCEELRPRSSDTDTSEPDVTEYSFTSGPKVPSTSKILADEISSSLELQVTKISPLNDSLVNIAQNSPKRLSSSDSCNSTDSSESNTCMPSKEHLSINTPPNTPPEGDQRDMTSVNIPSAKVFVPKQTQGSSFIVLKNFRSGSVSSSSSLSADELDATNVKASVSLLKK